MRKVVQAVSTENKSLMVRQSNALIEACYRIGSVGEVRLIRLLMAYIHKSDEDFKTYRITISDFARVFGLNQSDGRLYEMIKKTVDDLAGRRIMIEDGKNWLRMNWLSYAKYVHGSGCVELCFDKHLKPYLLQLKEHFTYYEIERAVHFRSGYAMRIFELLLAEQFKGKKKKGHFSKTFDYQELRKRIGVGEKEYKLFADFRVNIVERAVSEINANPVFRVVQTDYLKTGRKVTDIVFHCETAKQTQLDVNEPDPVIEIVEEKKKEDPDDVRAMCALGITRETAFKWRKKFGVKRVLRNIGYTQAMQKEKKIRTSVAGFLATAIQDDLGGAWAEEEARRKTAQLEQRAKENEEEKKTKQEADAKAKKRAELKAAFLALSEEERQSIRSGYEAQLSTVAAKTWNAAKNKFPGTPEEDPRVSVLFLLFFSKSRTEENHE